MAGRKKPEEQPKVVVLGTAVFNVVYCVQSDTAAHLLQICVSMLTDTSKNIVHYIILASGDGSYTKETCVY